MQESGLAGQVPPVLWTRGQGCSELATLLGNPIRVTEGLAEACVRHRAELLVSRRLLADFDLASLAVPIQFHPERVRVVVAAVAGGPHSALAARIAVRVAVALGVRSIAVHGYRDETHRAASEPEARHALSGIDGIEFRGIEAADPAEMVESLPSESLLVFGASGGGVLRRLLLGPGARLRARATTGAVVVRQAAPRVFHRMREPVFISPLREAADALLVHPQQILAVVDEGRLIGVVRRDRLEEAGRDTLVRSVMERPLSLELTDTLASAEDLTVFFGQDPIPVVDNDGRLVGGLSLD